MDLVDAAFATAREFVVTDHDDIEIAGTLFAAFALLAVYLWFMTTDLEEPSAPAAMTRQSVAAAVKHVYELEEETDLGKVASAREANPDLKDAEDIKHVKETEAKAASAARRHKGKRGASPAARGGGRRTSADVDEDEVPSKSVVDGPVMGAMTALGLPEQDYDVSNHVPKYALQPLVVPFFALFVTCAAGTAAVGAVGGTTEDWLLGFVGSAVAASQVFFYHSSVGLMAWAVAIFDTLVLSGVVTTASGLLPAALLLGSSWAVSHPSMQQAMGPQLNTLAVFGVFWALTRYFEFSYPVAAGFVPAAMLFFVSPATRTGTFVAALIAGIVTLVGMVIVGSWAVLEQSSLGFVAALSCALFALVSLLHVAQQKPVWGPFYTHETRASWISTFAFCLVALVTPEASHALLRLVIGFAVATLMVVVMCWCLEQWKTEDSWALRLASFDMFLVPFYFVIPAVVLYYNSDVGSLPVFTWLAGVRDRMLEVSLEVVPPVLTEASTSTRAIAAAIAVRAIAGVGLRFATARNLLLAPLSAVVTWRGSMRANTVALTFNGGPNASTTAALLDLLEEAGAKATFFVSAASARAAPDLVERMAEEGHQVGALGSVEGPQTITAVRADVRETCRAIKDIVGYWPSSYRPADGSRDARTVRAIGREGLATSLWSVVGWDWGHTPAPEVADEVAARLAKSGDVILLHEGVPHALPARGSHLSGGVNQGVVEVARLVLKVLEARGLRCAPLDEVCPPSWEVFKH